jgi:hypothetical protein
VRRGRGEDDRASGFTVGGEDRGGERLHHRTQLVGDGLGGVADGGLRPALGERHRLPGDEHRREVLPERVEQRVEQALTGQR